MSKLPVNVPNEILEQIETHIDRYGLIAIVDLLGEIASLKADYIRSNWQDDITADQWDLFAGILVNASMKLSDNGAS